MQELMQKSRQRMIIVLIIALLLVNFVICNSIVKAAAWPQDMSVNEYLGIYTDDITMFKQNLTDKSKPELAVKNLSKAWNISTDDVIDMLLNHQDDPGTLNVNFDGSVYTVDTITIKPTDEEKSKYGITTDSDGNASVNTNPTGNPSGSDDNDEEGGEDDIGGILFRPIASLICGIGDTCNTLLQRLLIGEKSDAFISRRIFFEF